MRSKFKHLTKTDRIKIEVLLKRKIPIKEIAEEIGMHFTTVYREIRLGKIVQRDSELIERRVYCADFSYARYRENLRAKGPGLKIGKDIALANYIEDKILNFGYSPAAVLGEISRSKHLKFSTTISEWTLYSYIGKGVFLNLTNKDLPVKGKRKKEYRKIRKIGRPPQGKSIEKRPEDVNERESFGHWEMDSLIGRGTKSHRLLVLTERLTRKEIAVRVFDGTSESVVRALDGIERKYGRLFYKIFCSITVDNGSEFSNCAGMEKSCRKKGNRTTIYYCHPYSSWERGSNEKQNQMLRRKFPKGTDFNKIANDEINKAVYWLNNYPREMFEFETAEMRYQAALSEVV